MLYTETVADATLELLKQIMNDSAFDDFNLVGGTALSLLIGHRISIDLDFFSVNSFHENDIVKHLQDNYSFELDYLSKNTIKGESKGVQLDFISHQYPIVETPSEINTIRIASKGEIAAMKLNAIVTNGTRIKDFIDIVFLAKDLSLNEMLDLYEQKYKANRIIALKSLSYFDDVNANEPIQFIEDKEKDWKSIKNHILKMIANPEVIHEA